MRNLVLVLCAVVGGVVGGLIAPMLRGDAQPAAQRETRRAAPDGDLARDLERRIENLERAGERWRPAPETAPPVRPEQGDEAIASTDADPGQAGKTQKPIAKPALELVKGLLGKTFTYDDSGKLFAWLARNREKIGDVIRALEQEVAADPDNPDLQVALASAWVAELVNNTPEGPQRGIVWQHVQKAYEAALKIEPEHWQARYGLAFGISRAPAFIGLTPVAIKRFEELRTIQEQRAPEPHYVQTYFQLGTLYTNMGNQQKARQVWEDGLKLFPNDAVLKAALEASTKR